jgi:hypothetical protein
VSKVADERTKLSATFINGVAIAMVAAGSIAPFAALSYGVSSGGTAKIVALVGFAWFLGGVALHFVALVFAGTDGMNWFVWYVGIGIPALLLVTALAIGEYDRWERRHSPH